MPCLVVEFDALLKIVMGAGKIAEIKASDAWNEVCDQGLGAIRPGGGFAQQKLRHFAHRCGFAAVQMPHPKTVIGGEPFRRVLHPARQFAGASALHRVAFRERREKGLHSMSSGNCWVGGKPSTADASTAYASASRLAAR